jgi:hypothetical protein
MAFCNIVLYDRNMAMISKPPHETLVRTYLSYTETSLMKLYIGFLCPYISKLSYKHSIVNVMLYEGGMESERWSLRNANSVLLTEDIFKFNVHFKI